MPNDARERVHVYACVRAFVCARVFARASNKSARQYGIGVKYQSCGMQRAQNAVQSGVACDVRKHIGAVKYSGLLN